MRGVTEQLVYEMGDPHAVHHAGRASRTSPPSSSAGRARTGCGCPASAGGRRTDKLKVSIAYFDGYKAVGTLVYAWPDAYGKGAGGADRILRERLEDLGLEFEQVLTEFVGVDATHGRSPGPPSPDARRGAAPRRRPGARSVRRSSGSRARSRPWS